MGQEARRRRVLGHVGEQPLHALELGDRLAELAPGPGIVDGGLERRLQDADRERGDPDPALVEHAHHHVEAAVLGTEPGVLRQLDAIEAQRADRRGALAHLALLGADLEARQVALDQEHAHAAPARAGVGARQHHREVADRRVVDPLLGAIQPPAARGARRRGADRGDIGAGIRLRDGVGAAALGAQQRAEILRLLVRAAVLRRAACRPARPARIDRRWRRSRAPAPPSRARRRAHRRRRRRRPPAR